MQSSSEITFHPIDLTRHGKNPAGQAVYRVVWADSRKSKVIAHGKVHVLPRYLHGDESSATGKWVLEKWVSPEVLLGMTRDGWDNFVKQVPQAAMEDWPEHGDYELSYVFPAEIDEALVHRMLDAHEYRFRELTASERKVELEQAEELKEEITDAKFDALYDEAREDSLIHVSRPS
jgi:hypothetical protein